MKLFNSPVKSIGNTISATRENFKASKMLGTIDSKILNIPLNKGYLIFDKIDLLSRLKTVYIQFPQGHTQERIFE